MILKRINIEVGQGNKPDLKGLLRDFESDLHYYVDINDAYQANSLLKGLRDASWNLASDKSPAGLVKAEFLTQAIQALSVNFVDNLNPSTEFESQLLQPLKDLLPKTRQVINALQSNESGSVKQASKALSELKTILSTQRENLTKLTSKPNQAKAALQEMERSISRMIAYLDVVDKKHYQSNLPIDILIQIDNAARGLLEGLETVSNLVETDKKSLTDKSLKLSQWEEAKSTLALLTGIVGIACAVGAGVGLLCIGACSLILVGCSGLLVALGAAFVAYQAVTASEKAKTEHDLQQQDFKKFNSILKQGLAELRMQEDAYMPDYQFRAEHINLFDNITEYENPAIGARYLILMHDNFNTNNSSPAQDTKFIIGLLAAKSPKKVSAILACMAEAYGQHSLVYDILCAMDKDTAVKDTAVKILKTASPVFAAKIIVSMSESNNPLRSDTSKEYENALENGQDTESSAIIDIIQGYDRLRSIELSETNSKKLAKYKELPQELVDMPNRNSVLQVFYSRYPQEAVKILANMDSVDAAKILQEGNHVFAIQIIEYMSLRMPSGVSSKYESVAEKIHKEFMKSVK